MVLESSSKRNTFPVSQVCLSAALPAGWTLDYAVAVSPVLALLLSPFAPDQTPFTDPGPGSPPCLIWGCEWTLLHARGPAHSVQTQDSALWVRSLHQEQTALAAPWLKAAV